PTPGLLQAELVPLGVLHHEPNLAALFDLAHSCGALALEARRHRLDGSLALLDRRMSPATDVDVEVHAVLGGFPLGDALEIETGPDALRVDDGAGRVPLLPWHSGVAQEVLPCVEPVRGVLLAVPERARPEPAQAVGIRAVEGDLEPDAHALSDPTVRRSANGAVAPSGGPSSARGSTGARLERESCSSPSMDRATGGTPCAATSRRR